MFIKTCFFLLLNLLSFQNVNSVIDTYDNVDYILVNEGNKLTDELENDENE